jgi:hypothetical protein
VSSSLDSNYATVSNMFPLSTSLEASWKVVQSLVQIIAVDV